ncbi:MAG TPA: LysR substrate-binding domain-containing protein [Polyangiaceae bacterium]|nr:LysR substrate-binding domain-containing protein [Polyangiaceae bacterium]
MSEHLDPDLLRTFLQAVDAGGLMRAAPRVGRTRAAVSLQMARLQAAVGQPLFRKVGRQLQLTPAGEALAGWARQILALNERALAAIRHTQTLERIRVGAPQDVVERWLPQVLAQFSKAHPHVRLELVVGSSRVLSDLEREGRLDLCVRFGLAEEANGERLGQTPVRFFAARSFVLEPTEPLALVLLDAPCIFRTSALRVLDEAGMPWRIAATSPSVSALWAAVAAGLGVTARPAISAPRGVREFEPPGVPALPHATLSLSGSMDSTALRALRRGIMSELRARLSRRGRTSAGHATGSGTSKSPTPKKA